MRKFRQNYSQDPSLILELGLYEMVGKLVDDEFKCLVCEDRVSTRQETERHLLRHFLEQENVDFHKPPASSTIGQERAAGQCSVVSSASTSCARAGERLRSASATPVDPGVQPPSFTGFFRYQLIFSVEQISCVAIVIQDIPA